MMEITKSSITFLLHWFKNCETIDSAHHLVKGFPTSHKAQQGVHNTNFKPKLFMVFIYATIIDSQNPFNSLI
jgi:hypothetical protein